MLGEEFFWELFSTGDKHIQTDRFAFIRQVEGLVTDCLKKIPEHFSEIKEQHN